MSACVDTLKEAAGMGSHVLVPNVRARVARLPNAAGGLRHACRGKFVYTQIGKRPGLTIHVKCKRESHATTPTADRQRLGSS